MREKRITIPEGANYYNYKKGKIKFFRANPVADFKKIPEKARGISFPHYQENAFNTNYGQAEFYDENGKILK